MPIETATFINDLNVANPVGASDDVRFGDDHIRLLKTVLKNTFPDGSAALRPPRVLLSTGTASNSATLPFTNIGVNNTLFKTFEFQFEDILPSVDGIDLWMQSSTDNGANYITTNVYQHVRHGNIFGASEITGGGANDVQILLIPNQGNNASYFANGYVKVFGANPSVHWQLGWIRAGEDAYAVVKGYGRISSGMNAIRFLYAGGNIASGTIRCYGVI